MVTATVILLLAGNVLILRKQVRLRTAELSQALAQLRHSLAAREKSAAELRRSHEYFVTMFNAIDDALFIHDAQTGQLLDVNQRMIAMYGYANRAEVLALPPEKLFADTPPYTWADARAWLCKARDEGPQTFEWRAPRHDGQLFWAEVNLRLARIGPDRRIIVTVRDITERKRAEEEQQRYDRRLQEAQKLESLGMLAGGIAHDFNNLLTAILGNIDLALLDIPRDSSARADLATAVAATRRAADLAQQMLAYSGKGHFIIEPLDVAEEIRSTTHMLQASISKSAALHIHLPADLPPSRPTPPSSARSS
jgi:PAS domain S-box-containing protein